MHPLLEIRRKFLEKQEPYMRLNTDEYFDNLQEHELTERLNIIGEFDKNEDLDTMKRKLKFFERSRHLQIWHDGSSVANHSHIMLSVNVLYDPVIGLWDKLVDDAFWTGFLSGILSCVVIGAVIYYVC